MQNFPHGGQTVVENEEDIVIQSVVRFKIIWNIYENLPNYGTPLCLFHNSQASGWWLRLPIDKSNSWTCHRQYFPSLGGSSDMSGGDVAASRNCLDTTQGREIEAHGRVRVQKEYFFAWPLVVQKMLLSRSLLRPNQCKIMQVYASDLSIFCSSSCRPFSCCLKAWLSCERVWRRAVTVSTCSYVTC